MSSEDIPEVRIPVSNELEARPPSGVACGGVIPYPLDLIARGSICSTEDIEIGKLKSLKSLSMYFISCRECTGIVNTAPVDIRCVEFFCKGYRGRVTSEVLKRWIRRCST